MSNLSFRSPVNLYPTTNPLRFIAVFTSIEEDPTLPDSAKYEIANIACPDVPTKVDYTNFTIEGDGWQISDIYLIGFADGRYTLSYLCEPVINLD